MSQMQPPYSTPPLPPYGPSTEAPGATVGLVLAILSIALNLPIVGLVLAILAYQKSKTAKQLCDAHPGAYSNAGIAQAGYIVSIVGLCLGALSLLCGCGYFAIVVLMIFGAAAGAAGGP